MRKILRRELDRRTDGKAKVQEAAPILIRLERDGVAVDRRESIAKWRKRRALVKALQNKRKENANRRKK
jgi:hypothetical protein